MKSESAAVFSASCPSDVAELFNKYFSSIVTAEDNVTTSGNHPPTTVNENFMSELILSPDDVLVALLNLDTNKATGPDSISPRLQKESAHQIAPSLCQLFNQSLADGSLPDEWKLANIIPVFKKGDQHCVENYRPISLLCIVSKVLERCVLSKLRDHLLELINSSQHGFIGKSCTTQLFEVLDKIGSLLDSGRQTDVVFLDMSKAFDKVNHAVLINKLRKYNIGASLLKWFSSYLHGRQQRVTVLGAISSSRSISSGVPQGSILGPILFLLYANDLPDVVVNSTVACFADDTKIFRCIDSIPDAVLLQRDLDHLDNWSSTNGINFNELKCKCLRITRKTEPIVHPYCINGKELKTTAAEKDLGIWNAEDLTWTRHVLDRCGKANQLLGFVRRSAAGITNARTRRTLYLSIVCPVFCYGSQVWSPQTINLVQRIERVQRRASKFILNLPFLCRESYRERLIALELLPLSYWHEYLDLVLFYKAVNGLVNISEDALPQRICTKHTTRSATNGVKFRPRKCKTLTFQRSFFIRVTWNALPASLRTMNINLHQFKNSLRVYYLDALRKTYDADNLRTWKTVCLKCNSARNLTNELTCCY